MAVVLITGGTGMIGKALTKALLEKNYEVIVLTREAESCKLQAGNDEKVSYAEWNIERQTADEIAIARADHIVHLAGANLGEERWTKKRKREIVSSRVDSGKLIVDCLRTIPNKVKSVISASAIGWYGPDLSHKQAIGGRSFKEMDSSHDDFLGQICKQWEDAIRPVTELGKRTVTLRCGIVLSKEGGAFPRFLAPLKFGFATILGSGKQIISWIHIDDLVKMY